MIGGYRQVVLRTPDSELICWLPNDDRLREGVSVTLKEIPDVEWKVVKVYGFVATTSPRKTWRVGGLN